MTTETLGERIRAARQAAGLSQEKLAERLGLTRQAVTKWETGQDVFDWWTSTDSDQITFDQILKNEQ